MNTAFALALAAFIAGFGAIGTGHLGAVGQEASKTKNTSEHPYVGMWVTQDGHIRQELLPNGRYDEARGDRQSAYQGRYEITGTHIDYWDDTGFTADGNFRDINTLYHGGYVFFRQPPVEETADREGKSEARQ